MIINITNFRKFYDDPSAEQKIDEFLKKGESFFKDHEITDQNYQYAVDSAIEYGSFKLKHKVLTFFDKKDISSENYLDAGSIVWAIHDHKFPSRQLLSTISQKQKVISQNQKVMEKITRFIKNIDVSNQNCWLFGPSSTFQAAVRSTVALASNSPHSNNLILIAAIRSIRLVTSCQSNLSTWLSRLICMHASPKAAV